MGTFRIGAWMLLVAALAALFLAFQAYITRLSGIDGTPGALLICISTAALAVSGLIYAVANVHGGAGTLLNWLVLLAIIGTAVAAYLLMQFWIVALMCVSLLGFILHLARHREAIA